MCLNELCTNAVKYGALSNTTGRIDITSTVDEKAQRLKLTWTEMGGPAVQGPTRLSFGTRLIKGLAGQLHGDVRLRYEPEGASWSFQWVQGTDQTGILWGPARSLKRVFRRRRLRGYRVKAIRLTLSFRALAALD